MQGTLISHTKMSVPNKRLLSPKQGCSSNIQENKGHYKIMKKLKKDCVFLHQGDFFNQTENNFPPPNRRFFRLPQHQEGLCVFSTKEVFFNQTENNFLPQQEVFCLPQHQEELCFPPPRRSLIKQKIIFLPQTGGFFSYPKSRRIVFSSPTEVFSIKQEEL